MKSHDQALFYVATLTSGYGPERILLPGRSREVIETYSAPPNCRIELHKAVWRPLEDLRDEDDGLTFYFEYEGVSYWFGQSALGYDYLLERYRAVVNEYYRTIHPDMD
ncbi:MULTISPECIES: hypothetical protein [Pseudomonas]|jgi:hypothetical protein|uniref:hypothetical protein n=1 Tax=Pseudomonas TaxID=286 RepID=UPI00026FBFD7|nr:MULTISPECIES: hypothetical protein [Pseudomonas]EJN32222.1 hypothetical protein PMI37_02296 [Pseudomonas sp. GM80]GLH39104.1 hypothetical protein RS1P1_33880 [Pseudomonas moraviensis]